MSGKGIFMSMSAESAKTHRARRAAMGRDTTWGEYLDKLAALADEHVKQRPRH